MADNRTLAMQFRGATEANSTPQVRTVMKRSLHPLIVAHVYGRFVSGYSMEGDSTMPAHAGAVLVRSSAPAFQLGQFRRAGGVVLDIGNDDYLKPSQFLVREAYLGKASEEQLCRLDEGRRLGLDLVSALPQAQGSDEESFRKIKARIEAPLALEHAPPMIQKTYPALGWIPPCLAAGPRPARQTWLLQTVE